ncbi:MAG: hypothetical protein K0S47_2826 [Herbinix sp.]|jgi:hypothetical protein|nr:hypothetical protein [Herbinix sp.]
MEPQCLKCNERLTKCTTYSTGDTFIAVKATAKSFTENSSRMIPYVCSKCGLIEWYVEKPSNFK